MTREEAIKLIDTHTVCFYNEIDSPTLQALHLAIEALSADAIKRVDCSNFLLWLLEEIMDEDNWELNAVADGEIIARKLKKLGLLEVKDGYYHRIFDENVWVVRCKDCKNWRESHSEDEESYCYIDGRTTDSTGFCSRGERREPLPQYEEWQDEFNKMCESARPKNFVADEWYRDTFKEEEE